MSIDDATPTDWDTIRNVMDLMVDDKPNKGDPVNKPDHYNVGSIEAIEAIKASMPPQEFKGYLKGNIMKYLWRYDYKGKPIEDLRKARWYLEKLIEENL